MIKETFKKIVTDFQEKKFKQRFPGTFRYPLIPAKSFLLPVSGEAGRRRFSTTSLKNSGSISIGPISSISISTSFYFNGKNNVFDTGRLFTKPCLR